MKVSRKKMRRRKNRRHKFEPLQSSLETDILKQNPKIAYVTEKNQWIKARTENQEKYIAAIKENDIIVCAGPAGTGKTYVAVAVGLELLKLGKIGKIIITRPVVEAGGEKLGFLPGDLQEKINPYLRPIYDAFNAILGVGQVQIMLDQEEIEIAPLAYMRGRTLENCFIILDEAQNATSEQIEMLLTRMGKYSKVVVNGDTTQVDLKNKNASGLGQLVRIIKELPKVIFFEFTDQDVVRHSLVGELVKRYREWKTKNRK